MIRFFMIYLIFLFGFSQGFSGYEIVTVFPVFAAFYVFFTGCEKAARSKVWQLISSKTMLIVMNAKSTE